MITLEHRQEVMLAVALATMIFGFVGVFLLHVVFAKLIMEKIFKIDVYNSNPWESDSFIKGFGCGVLYISLFIFAVCIICPIIVYLGVGILLIIFNMAYYILPLFN